MAALGICELLLLALTELKIISDQDARDLLTDVATTHNEAAADFANAGKASGGGQDRSAHPRGQERRAALAGMTAAASPKGWVVRVTTKRLGGLPAVEIYDVAIADAVDAVEAVRRAYGAGPDTIVEIVAELPAGTDLRDGEVLLR